MKINYNINRLTDEGFVPEMPRGILTKKQLTMKTYDLFMRSTTYGTTEDIMLEGGQPTDSFIKNLNGLLSDGKIIAYGYTTLQPY
jgi:hypothetical protein